MDFYANLHLHSTHSDGPYTPREFNHVFNLLTAKGIEKTENYMNWFNKNFREQRGKYPPVSNFLPTDKLLADGLIAVMKDGTPSLAPLCDGIVSAEICLAARESARNHVFVDVN